MDKINIINTPVGDWHRLKNERQRQFINRTKSEFREIIKSMFKYSFEGKDHNQVIIRFPIRDLDGNSILDSQQDNDLILQSGKITLKYIKLKFRFEAEE